MRKCLFKQVYLTQDQHKYGKRMFFMILPLRISFEWSFDLTAIFVFYLLVACVAVHNFNKLALDLQHSTSFIASTCIDIIRTKKVLHLYVSIVNI